MEPKEAVEKLSKLKPPKNIEKFIQEGTKFLCTIAPDICKVGIPVTIVKDENTYYVYCDVAGVKKEDIEIYAQNNGFFIIAERHPQEDMEFGEKIKSEIEFGKIKKFVEIPLGEIESLSTSLDNGILKIVIPVYRGKKIEIL